MGSLKAQEKYITFSVPISKTLDNSMIALDLCQSHYQVLLITCLKFTKKNAKDARKGGKTNKYAILLGLKIIN